jgi:hypothetical protein
MLPSQLPPPSFSPSLTASLSESASALNYGSRVNFTVSVDGGQAPYSYVWYLDNQSMENSSSPYYATDSQSVGSHHVYVQVTDAQNNSATTLTVEFNVLPATSYSASPTQQQTPTLSPIPEADTAPDYTLFLIVGVVVIIAVVLGLLAYLARKKQAEVS